MTRHNLGFLLIDRLFERTGGRRFREEANAEVGQIAVAGERVLLVKPQTYMNLSGNAVATVVMAKWEGELDEARLRAVLNGHAGEDYPIVVTEGLLHGPTLPVQAPGPRAAG